MAKNDITAERRHRMVETQLVERGIANARVLAAMGTVARERFVACDQQDLAYEDRPLPIGEGQTISQPYIVAFMIEALQLEPEDKVLEIGGGSGYAAAVLAHVARTVVTIERLPALADLARRNLAAAGVKNVTMKCADGTLGWPEDAPFDAILVSAGAPDVPRPLLEQLAVGGRIVVPVGGDPTSQDLIRIVRTAADRFERTLLTSVRFVPLIGEAGWQPDTG